ncbi:StAR-related lipid-transfer domain-containing protein [Phytophthora infestans]|uniref:Phosphatidylcholine transfer protein n=1 Tax=Phytophthora infestans TaxID=4787 RepID=A0A833THK8_PHYIN|nr:StAR-related lipid-transfer domain-containing protein [Phytophthora infestans]
MSSFEAPKSTRSGSRVAALGKRPSLMHRSSDPEFSDAELDDAVDMGENAVWANLQDPIYAEKDVEIFRPTQKDSTLPVYYAKGWLPFPADTLFDSLMDARYRKTWDSTVHEVHVVEHQHVSDVMYFALNLPWPLANRDYVYRRRVKFYPTQNAFVVLCQAAHHADAPTNGVRVRVETCTLRLCIRSMSSSNDSCDFHLEYEDDTNFSIPNYVVNMMLHTMMSSFMTGLRKACKGYAEYMKSLDDDDAQSIPSQVVRQRAAVLAAATTSVTGSVSSVKSTSVIGASVTEERKPVRASQRPRSSLFFLSTTKRKPELLQLDTDERSCVSEDWGDDTPRSEPPTTQSLRPSPTHRSASTEIDTNNGASRSHLSHSSSANSLDFLGSSSVSEFSLTSTHTPRSVDGVSTPLDDDFTIKFRKQKVGLHLETDLFSNKVLVAFCEKDSEAAICGERIEPGFLVTSVNGVAVSDFNFTEALGKIQRAPRPLTLGFTHPDREASLQYRRFKEPQNVLKCLVSRDEIDLLGALRPLDEEAAISAVLKCDFVAPAATVSAMASLSPKGSSPALLDSPSKQSTTNVPKLHASASMPQPGKERVLVPAGYLVYEINDSYVLDVPFAEIAHLLRRSGDVCVVTFKAAMAIVGGPKQRKSRYKLPKRLPGVFRKMKRRASDASMTASMSSASAKSLSSDGDTRQPKDANSGLADYYSVAVTASNIDWVWQQVLLLKVTERIFSAALLIDRLEAFLTDTDSAYTSIAAAKTKILQAMHDEKEMIEHVKERRDQGVRALKDFSDKEGDDDWQFGQTMLGVTTSWKPDDDGSVWIKLEGLVDGVDIFNTISVIREVDLYSVWTPFCSQSLLLQSMGHVELAAYLAISSPFLQRDAIIRAYGINAVYEHNCLLLLGGSVDVSSVNSAVPVPTLQGWNAGRMEIKGFRALIEPLTRMQARTCIVANIDPKCAIPKPMLNFGIKKMAGILLYLIRKEAEKIENDTKKTETSATNEHIRRITSDPSGFYTWLRPIVDKYFIDQSNKNLPEPLSLPSDAQVQYNIPRVIVSKSTRTGSPRLAKLRSSTRIAAFHRNGVGVSADTRSSMETSPASSKCWGDYLYDVVIWPYLLLFIFAKMSADLSLLYACMIKFVFTCTCTYLAVPGTFPRATRHWKRTRNELEPLRRQCVVLAAICDVLSSYALRVWVRWVQCYLSATLNGSAGCFSRSQTEVRESDQLSMMVFGFLYASAIVGMQIAVNF